MSDNTVVGLRFELTTEKCAAYLDRNMADIHQRIIDKKREVAELAEKMKTGYSPRGNQCELTDVVESFERAYQDLVDMKSCLVPNATYNLSLQELGVLTGSSVDKDGYTAEAPSNILGR